MPGVLGVFTGDDLARPVSRARARMLFKGKDGTTLKDPPRPALAQGRVRFVGEPVALVVAESEAAAQDAAETIAVDYRDLPVVDRAAGRARERRAGAARDVPDNLALDYEYGNKAAADEAFAKATHVARVTLTRSASPARRWSRSPAWPRTTPDRSLRPLYADAGHGRHPDGPSPHHRAADREIPYPRPGRRRRLRRAQRGLSRVRRARFRGEGRRPAGEMGRHALGEHAERSSRSRRAV